MTEQQIKQLCQDRDTLLKALKAAQEHLQYCGYGDSYERDCANAVHLDQQICAAILQAESRETK